MNDNDPKTQKDEEKILPPYAFYESTQTNRALHFYLSSEIGEPKIYTDMIHRIRTAGPTDVIYISLNTPGGRLDTGVQILSAMASSQAKIITVLEATAHSLGTLLFLSGDEFIVHENCLMMFHTMSSGTFGKSNEQVAQIDASTKWFIKLMKKICVPFLSEEEVARIIKGEDIWLDSDEIRKRLIKMTKMQPPGKKSKRKVKEETPDA